MTERAPTPWHLWVIAIVSLLWNAMGAMDYVMTQTRNEAYMSQFTEAQLAYFYGFPAWVQATWAIAVWSGVLGSILLLLRTRHAVPVFWVSLLTMVATAIHNFILSDTSMSEIVGPFAIIFTAVIFVVAVLLVGYSARQKAAGVLA